MKKLLLGLLIGIILMSFAFVFIIQQCHIYIEKQADIQWCVRFDEAIEKTFGKGIRQIFYVSFKIFNYPLRSFYIIRNFNNEITVYPKSDARR